MWCKGSNIKDFGSIEYYPFGMMMIARQYLRENVEGYRYAFNGQERDDEVSGEGNSYTAEYWQYDARLGRRWNLDPKPNPSISSYATFAGNPIYYSDPYGDTIRVSEALRNNKEAYQGFLLWKNSRAGMKFYKRYDIGGSHEAVLVEFALPNDKSNFTKEDGTTYQSALSGPIQGNADAVTASFNYNSNTGTLTGVASESWMKQWNRHGVRKSSEGYSISSDMNGDLKIQIRLATKNMPPDTREIAMFLLHETQHVRIMDFQKRMYGKAFISTTMHHLIMKDNYRKTWLINGTPIKIYDFRAERWQFLKEYERPGETDESRDKMVNDFGL